MSDEDTKRQFPREGDEHPNARSLDALFELIESLRKEFTEFREKAETRLLNTTPLSETLEAIRVDVGTIGERQDTLGKHVAEIAKTVSELGSPVTELTRVTSEIAKGNRRIESKVNGISIDFAEMKGILQDHEERLQALNSH